MGIKKVILQPSYKKENGLWLLHITPSLLPKDFHLVEQSLLSIPPQQFGGNHKHPRKEAFIATSKDVLLYWLDEKEEKHEEIMFDENMIVLFIVDSNVPHVIVNKSKTASALLCEFADYTQHNVQAVNIL